MRRQTKHVRPMCRHFGRLLSQMALPATVKRPCYDPIVCATRILISFSALPGGSGFKPVFRTHDYHILLSLANVTHPVGACFSTSMQASHSGTYRLSTLRNDMPDLGVARGFCLAITPTCDREGRLAQGSSPKAIRVWFHAVVSKGSTEGLTLPFSMAAQQNHRTADLLPLIHCPRTLQHLGDDLLCPVPPFDSPATL